MNLPLRPYCTMPGGGPLQLLATVLSGICACTMLLLNPAILCLRTGPVVCVPNHGLICLSLNSLFINCVHIRSYLLNWLTLCAISSRLPVLYSGSGTKAIEGFMAAHKEYSGTLKLGEGTASLDAETEVEERLPWEHITGTAGGAVTLYV